jgi:hypothetical protein
MGKIKEVLRLRFEPTILSCARARVVSRVLPCRVRFRRVHPCSLGKPNLGLQHLTENTERVASDNLG